MFVVFELDKTIQMVNLDNITEIKYDYNNNVLVMYKDSGVWDNWTFKDSEALTKVYNHIVDGLNRNMKIITISMV